MQQYLDLLARIVKEGRQKSDRTQTGTKSVFGAQMRWNLQDGLPMVTTRKISRDVIRYELDWFVAGQTNTKFLTDNNIKIWNQWALEADITVSRDLTNYQRVQEAIKMGVLPDDFESRHQGFAGSVSGNLELDRLGVPGHGDVPKYFAGDLGPIYGRLWRSWGKSRIDQLQVAIDTLKERPDSRRIIVSAWDPEVLPDESKGPQENVANGLQALAPCHCFYQFYTESATLKERLLMVSDVELFMLQGLDPETDSIIAIDDWIPTLTENEVLDNHRLLDMMVIPKLRLSCQLYQRSADVPVGVPYNITEYSVLTHVVAQLTNMIPGDFIWSGGDCHIYADQMGGVIEQLTREPLPLPQLVLKEKIKNIDCFSAKMVDIVGYEHHPAIKYNVAK